MWNVAKNFAGAAQSFAGQLLDGDNDGELGPEEQEARATPATDQQRLSADAQG